ncbi:peptide ABC transporter substrate-binding protein [Enterovibrio norvegicus FF-33]|uniref:Peptide ABC transporter substrate-binding protein n=1 Tax=Enterovibrio norvegicus FF-454 TaxID=1185651 RepID=A0A1E5BY69_9GAMM|nr:ABC transporter substrate-binding protein [Enterovibrio norvegicus]OEE58226.1 peptide ABC transporter substrate-binding protein [Enterovibrio norvegicus FF-454]OEE67247.1 peptide ABC transporter substrate-binding protein [Enterovibrio norvegicus FF-33]OEE80053.1 peptide ABC transporter substrate-binding protein [Enterovibrio norvegicus FF-162]
MKLVNSLVKSVISLFIISPMVSLAAPEPGSHLKVFIPSLPYLYISHSINGALLRPANNDRGWDYDMAVSHRKVDDTTYEFNLRQGVKFQDGTPFNADAVLMNMKFFKEDPFLFTKIDTVFDRAEKVDDYTVRFHLTEKYGQFLNDAIWIQFYTQAYLDKFGWNGKPTCPNLAEPGPYGLGPYILKEGYIEGDRQTPKAVLVANPNYWNSEFPKIETVTVYTELDSNQALEMAIDNDAALDIMPIPFSEKKRVEQSRFAKLVSAPSTNNIAIHINMRTGNKRLLDKDVRVALNKAIDQRRLLEKNYAGEGQISPTLAAPLYPGVDKVVKNLKAYSEVQNPKSIRDELKKTLDGLELNVYTQDRFMYIWKGIDRDLRKVGVKLNFTITSSEKDVFGQLLTTNAKKNTEDWDLLVWGNDDWYYNHPWSAFFVYRTHNAWSTIFPDSTLDGYIEKMFRESAGTPEFDDVSDKIMRHAYNNGYMLFVPTPNKVLAVNRNVNYSPFRMANMPLWEIEVTPSHWSVK